MEYKCNYAFQTLFELFVILTRIYSYITSIHFTSIYMYIELKKYELVSLVTYWQCDHRYFAVIYSTDRTNSAFSLV